MNKHLRLFAAAVALSGGVACHNAIEDQLHGALLITTTSPSVAVPITTADNWSIRLNKLLVNVSEISVAGDDGVVTASASGLVIDLVDRAPKTLVEALVRKARPWEQVSFMVGPVLDDEETEYSPIEPVAEQDILDMKAGGYSVYVDGIATRGEEIVIFRWGFATDTLYSDCEGEVDGNRVRGLVVPVDERDAANIEMRGHVVFSSDLDPGSVLRFDAIASADTDASGDVTLEELEAVALDDARESGMGSYGVSGDSEISTLGGFIEERTRHLVSAFRTRGSCRSAPVEE